MTKTLYDVAREVTHAMGMPWTDPRTGKTLAPPEPDPATEIEQWMRKVFRRQGAVHAHAQTLACPECTSPQNQILNLSEHGKDFEWRCRMCRCCFVSGRE